MDAGAVIERAFLSFRPPPRLTCSQWADENRYVSGGPFPGRWQTDRTPYLREPMDCVTDPQVEMIVVVKPTRIGGTEIINNAIGFHIHLDPCQILYVQTSLDEGRKYSESILRPMVEWTQVLRERMAMKFGKKIGTTTKIHKSFFGGDLDIVGAKSPKGFRMVSKKLVICDDVSGYESTPEGDPVALAIGRAKDYWDKKLILVSNPGVDGQCLLQPYYEQSDKRLRYVPCARCGAYQVLEFGGKDLDYGLKWQGDDIWYLCAHCHEKIYQHEILGMDLRGEWRAQGEFNGVAGFKLNPFLCSWHPWKDFRLSKAHRVDINRVKVFVTQTLGEWWKEDREELPADALISRREAYPAEVPMGVGFLTAGVDVQGDRLEVAVKGWGLDEESWLIEHHILYGDPAKIEVWDALDVYLQRSFIHETGNGIEIQCVLIDSGGHHTDRVYTFCLNRQGRGVFASKGSNVRNLPIIGRASLVQNKRIKLFLIGTDTAKALIYGRLKGILPTAGQPEAGCMHFPESVDAEYFEQLTAEYYSPTKSLWLKRRARNEALDLEVLNVAALRRANPSIKKLLEQLHQYSPERPAPVVKRKAYAGGMASWVNSWRK